MTLFLFIKSDIGATSSSSICNVFESKYETALILSTTRFLVQTLVRQIRIGRLNKAIKAKFHHHTANFHQMCHLIVEILANAASPLFVFVLLWRFCGVTNIYLICFFTIPWVAISVLCGELWRLVREHAKGNQSKSINPNVNDKKEKWIAACVLISVPLFAIALVNLLVRHEIDYFTWKWHPHNRQVGKSSTINHKSCIDNCAYTHHTYVAQQSFSKILGIKGDVVAADTIAKFAEARRGGNDGETFSELNQLMDELLDLPVIPADYGETMAALYRDKAHDDITRDFAVQHIGLYAQALNRSGAYDPDSDDARLCRDAILEAAAETRTVIAAAAFRALADVSAFDPHIDGKRIDAMLVSCAGDASASPAARVMAVQLCGERGVVSSRAMLEEVLSDAAAPAPLRRAAKWSLSRLSGDSP